jgi:hypothetical protein
MFIPGGAAFAALSLLQLVVPLVTAVAVVVIAVTLVRGGIRGAGSPPQPEVLEQRLDHLDRLHAAGRLSDAERAEARARLLGTV